MTGRMRGRTAVVTGAASGIGHAIAERFGAEGAAVVLADVDSEGAAAAAEAFAHEDVDALAVTCDITDRADTARLVEETTARFGGVDVLVNNAGIATHGSFADLEPADWDRVLDVNLTGAYNCTRAALPSLVASEHAAVVNVSSMAGRNISYHAAANYTASKWGLVGLTKHLAWDLAGDGVRVNAVCPGSTLTPLIESSTTPDARAATEAKIPLGRWATPEDQASGVCFLASDDAAHVTGTVLEIDGGKQLGVRHEI